MDADLSLRLNGDKGGCGFGIIPVTKPVVKKGCGVVERVDLSFRTSKNTQILH